MSDYYVLRDKKAVKIERPDAVLQWAKEYETDRMSNRRVAETLLDGDKVRVSTVFLGLDHSFGQGAPLLFETLIFGGPHSDYQERYSTWDEAEVGHAKAVNLASGEDTDGS